MEIAALLPIGNTVLSLELSCPVTASGVVATGQKRSVDNDAPILVNGRWTRRRVGYRGLHSGFKGRCCDRCATAWGRP